MIVNRLKKGESTLCTYTTTGEQIYEGHILGYGDNYPCIVLYDKFEAKFVAIEFGYMKDEGYLYRNHDIICSTTPWKVLGHIDITKDRRKYLYGKDIPRNFDYTKDLSQYYEDHLELEKKNLMNNFVFVKEEESLTQKIIKNTKSW